MSAESAFIATLRALATHPAARGLNDDCAVIELGSETLILTHDAMAEGVHFLPGQDRADVAWKLVASNLSDLAAKGAEPLGVLLGYQLGGDDARFLAGLGEVLTHYNVPLLGGDTISATGAQVLGLARQEFVDAARSLGLPAHRIIFRHIIPNVLGPVIVYATLTVPAVMLLEAALSFLSLGVQPPDSSWGTLINDGAKNMESQWWLLAFPAGIFSTTLFCLNFAGDGLRDALDVRGSKD